MALISTVSLWSRPVRKYYSDPVLRSRSRSCTDTVKQVKLCHHASALPVGIRSLHRSAQGSRQIPSGIPFCKKSGHCSDCRHLVLRCHCILLYLWYVCRRRSGIYGFKRDHSFCAYCSWPDPSDHQEKRKSCRLKKYLKKALCIRSSGSHRAFSFQTFISSIFS